jgi:hypothetical protein
MVINLTSKIQARNLVKKHHLTVAACTQITVAIKHLKVS